MTHHREATELVAAVESILVRLCQRDPSAAALLSATGRWLAALSEPFQHSTTTPTTIAPHAPADVAPASPPPVETTAPAHLQSTIATADTATNPTPTAPSVPPSPPDAAPGQPTPSSVSVPLRIGDAHVQIAVPGTKAEAIAASLAARPVAQTESDSSSWAAPDLTIVAQRCALKAQACEAAARRQETESLSPEERRVAQDEVNRLLAAKDSLPNCFLWMFHRDFRLTPAEFRSLIPCYNNLALAANVAQRAAPRDPESFRSAVYLLAESQSALRCALSQAWFPKEDVDQRDAFLWLRNATDQHRIFIDRYMRLDDPADPRNHSDLRNRLLAAEGSLRHTDNRGRETRNLLKKLRYHAQQISETPDEDRPHDWKVLVETVGKLADHGVLPGDDRLSDALDDVLAIPQNRWPIPPETHAPLVAIRELVTDDQQDPTQPQAQPRPESAEVQTVRTWLRGKRAVFIGGQRYAHAAQRIQRAFGLSDLHWLELTEHGATSPIHPPIADPTTAVVWVAIRLTGHLHVDVATDACRTLAKPLVRLPAGYNPSQIALQTIEQAGAAFR